MTNSLDSAMGIGRFSFSLGILLMLLREIHNSTMNSQLQQELQQLLNAQGYGQILSITNIGGGCINETCLLKLSDGQTCFIKSHAHPPAGFFQAEAAGLNAIANTHSARVPNVIATTDRFLLLEYIEQGSATRKGWQDLGTQLAQMHSTTSTHFGFETDNFCGLTPQPNRWETNGYAFYTEQRLLYQARLASNKKRLPAQDMINLEKVAGRLPQLIPEQNAVLIHGDLWSGNVLFDTVGQPLLIDPATHFGWREADIAMTQLFGGFAADFYAAYEEACPLEAGWQERVPLHNLYHLLNHLNLFGSGYLSQVRAAYKRYI